MTSTSDTSETGTNTMSEGNGTMNITRAEFNSLRDMVGDIHQRLLGDRNNPGMVVEVDRIKTWMASRQWLERTIVGSLVTLAVGFLGLLAVLIAVIVQMA